MTKVEAAVIHNLVKDRHGETSVVARQTLLPLSGPVVKLVTDIHDLYSERPGKGFGRFQADEINFPAAALLREHFKVASKSFIDMTKDLMTVLKTKAAPVSFATGGFVLMAHMSNASGAQWFIVAIINNVHGNAVNEITLDIVDSVQVDMQHLRVAGRVNIVEWLIGDKDVRYVGFLKQKGGVSDYFKLFLGCDELIAAAEETKKLLGGLKQFAVEMKLDAAAQAQLLSNAHDFGLDCHKSGKPLLLEELSNAVWPTDPKALQISLAKASIQINDGFVPDRGVLRGYLRIKAKTPYWSIDIDRQALVSGQIQYDAKNHTLTLSELPEALEAELRRELG